MQKAASGSTRRQFGRDITNSAPIEAPRDKASKAVMPPQPAMETARVDDITVQTNFAAAMGDRPYMDRPSDDIDARDVDNPLLCTEYVNAMYDNFRVMERETALNANYMAKQSFINDKMRSILVDWMVDLHLRFKMVPETLYLTINMLDRYLQVKQVRRSKLQLVGVACMSLAAKYEEIYPPELRDYVHSTDRAYSRAEIVEMETDVANTLQYNLTVPTIHSFLCRFLKAAHADRTMVQLACYLAERTLQEYSMCNFLPSIIAASAVLVARKSLRRHPWSPTLVKYTKYDEPELASCIAELQKIVGGNGQQQAVHRKYSTQKFGSVATLLLEF